MNYCDLLNIKYKSHYRFLVVVIIIFSLGIYIGNIKIDSVYNALGYFNGEELVVNVPIDNPDILNKMEYITVLDKKYNSEIVSVGEILLDQASLLNYQEVRIADDFQLVENQMIKVTFYHSKEKVIEKIKKLL